MKPYPISNARRRRGFTMVEMMVVIVILAVLASIAFMVANRAKAKARSLQCLSNVRDWSTSILAANTDLGGGRMFCPNDFMSIGPDESPFVPYWAEAAGLSGGNRRFQTPVRDQFEYDQEYKAKIAALVQERRSCPCIEPGLNQYGNSASSYTMNTFLQSTGQFYQGATTRFPVIRLADVRRVSRKIYMVDCQSNGAQSMRTQGKGNLIQGVREVEKEHGGKVNALFLDMHIEQISSGEMENDWNALTQPES
jgi:prepilin-type N-terminal cleavage/methylation domain-containing protein/prepilin-type processing-associated H-X9-DG protein